MIVDTTSLTETFQNVLVIKTVNYNIGLIFDIYIIYI